MAGGGRHRKLWERRKKRSRKQFRNCERPLLVVFRSAKHTYAQLVDPLSHATITGASTRSPAVRSALKGTGNVEAAKAVGTEIAKLALDRDIKEVTFNRNGFIFHGRVKALADAAREAGLSF